jgi:hypothetical protein
LFSFSNNADLDVVITDEGLIPGGLIRRPQ